MRAHTIVGVVIWLLLCSALPPRANSQMKGRVAWTSFASNMSGTWVAREEELFKKNGLEVELVHIPSTSRAIQTLFGRRTCLHVYGRTHGGPGHTQGRGCGNNCRCRQSTGLFVHGTAGN